MSVTTIKEENKFEKTLMVRLLDAGCRRRSMRESGCDLVLPVNEKSTPVINAYYNEHNLERGRFAPIEQNPVTGIPEYRCKSEWDVFWECGDLLYGERPYTMDD